MRFCPEGVYINKFALEEMVRMRRESLFTW